MLTLRANVMALEAIRSTRRWAMAIVPNPADGMANSSAPRASLSPPCSRHYFAEVRAAVTSSDACIGQVTSLNAPSSEWRAQLNGHALADLSHHRANEIGREKPCTSLAVADQGEHYVAARTGKGSCVTTSLLAGGVWAAGVLNQAALVDAKFFPPHDRKNPANEAMNLYQTSDGKWFLLLVMPDKLAALAKGIGRSDLLNDPRFEHSKPAQ
jgi:hypothetical protein